jgi:hypothetical protein
MKQIIYRDHSPLLIPILKVVNAHCSSHLILCYNGFVELL